MNTIQIEVSIIIINYNTDELTIQAVESVLKYVKDISFEIIVVDNDSKETKLASALSAFQNTHFYPLDSNIGFGNANNFGYSKSKGDFIFLLNSDAFLIAEDTIPSFIDYLENNKNVGCVGGNLVSEKGETNISYGNFLSIEKTLHDYGIKKARSEHFYATLATSRQCCFNEPTPVDYLTAAAIMLKRELIEKLGLFDPRYFMYFEDMDLCFRYQKNGYLCVLLPDVKIVHIGGQSGLASFQNNTFLNKQIQYSKYLFLQNVSTLPTAYFLFLVGKMVSIYRRVKRKIKRKMNE